MVNEGRLIITPTYNLLDGKINDQHLYERCNWDFIKRTYPFIDGKGANYATVDGTDNGEPYQLFGIGFALEPWCTKEEKESKKKLLGPCLNEILRAYAIGVIGNDDPAKYKIFWRRQIKLSEEVSIESGGFVLGITCRVLISNR